MELNLFEVILAGYLSSILLLMWRLWWPCHKFMFAGPMVWVCIVSDNMRERFCAKYVVTILENEK